MSENITKNNSKTDWEHLQNMTDADIDTTDIPPLSDDFFKNAEVRLPQSKVPITIRLDPDVLTWFRSHGRGYQTLINAVLRTYVEAHKNESG